MRRYRRVSVGAVRLVTITLLGVLALVACAESSVGAPVEPRVAEHPGRTASRTATPTPTADLAAQAAQPPFPDADVLHIVQVVEPFNHEGETRTNETWINRTTGEVVVRQTDTAGNLRELTVKQGLTVQEYRAEPDSSFSSLSVTTVLAADDPNLPDPLNHLNLFRDRFRKYPERPVRGDVELDPDSFFEGQPAVKLTMPLRENEQDIGTVAAYLHPETLYPLAIVQYAPEMTEEDGQGHRYFYPTIEPLGLATVPASTFDPEFPEAQYSYIHERFAPGAAAQFNDYPIWWLGQRFWGYELQYIERYRTTTPEGQVDNDKLTAFYLPAPDQYEDQLQIVSEPPLTDIEWAHRDANHNVHSFEQTEIQVHPAWVQPGAAYVEIQTPKGFVSISASTDDLALAAAEILQQINAASIDAQLPPSLS